MMNPTVPLAVLESLAAAAALVVAAAALVVF
jgi:hypothetical protein